MGLRGRKASRGDAWVQMHVLSGASRAARQSTGGGADSPAGASVSSTPGTSGKKGKPKAVAVRWARCGSGDEDCTCARCNKAREQEVGWNRSWSCRFKDGLQLCTFLVCLHPHHLIGPHLVCPMC